MRKIRIATVSLPHPTLDPDEVRAPGPEQTFELVEAYVREAADLGADFVCLPEIFAYFNTAIDGEDSAEELDGPAHSFLARVARECQTIVVATVLTRRPEGVFNMGVWYDRGGALAGSYDKVHLAPGEEAVAVPGDDFPVHEIDGVRVGMQICYDLNFPEGCRILALRGAEVIFWPNLWGGMPEDHTEMIMRTRAVENQVCLVSSACMLAGDGFFRVPKVHGRSCVIDRNGTIVAEVGLRTGVVVAGLDFDEPSLTAAGNQETLTRDRRPETYGRLASD